MASNKWTCNIKWDGSSYIDEAERMNSLNVYRGRQEYIREGGSGIEPVDTGSATIHVDNYDGRYDPYNASSPLFPYCTPGKFVQIMVDDGTTNQNVISGIIQDIIPVEDTKNVKIIVNDGVQFLTESIASTQLYEGITIDEAINDILDAAGYPAEWGKLISTGADIKDYYWASEEKRAYAELIDLINSELGNAFVAADGKFIFRSRHDFEMSKGAITQDQMLKNLVIQMPWKFQRNIIKVSYHPRIAHPSQVVWTNRETPYISAGDSIEIWANFTYEGATVPVKNIVAPAPSTDYTANTADDDSGTDLTSQISIEKEVFATSTKLTITNNASMGCYLTLMQLRGEPIEAPDTSTVVANGVDYDTNPKTLELDFPWLQNYNTANDFASYLKTYLSAPKEFITAVIQDRPAIQFAYDLFDIVTLDIEKKNINADYRIGGIEHEFLFDNGKSVLTKFYCEPYSSVAGVWRFPTEYGISSVFGW